MPFLLPHQSLLFLRFSNRSFSELRKDFLLKIGAFERFPFRDFRKNFVFARRNFFCVLRNIFPNASHFAVGKVFRGTQKKFRRAKNFFLWESVKENLSNAPILSKKAFRSSENERCEKWLDTVVFCS